MKEKKKRMETLKMLISSMELGSQEEVLNALRKEGFTLTQATLSRDVLPNETMYKRISKNMSAAEMLQTPGFLSIHFSGNIGVIKTRPGYASSIAYNIDNTELPHILGTIAGDDTIFIVMKPQSSPDDVIYELETVIPNVKDYL